jgi:hypothetical protein
MLVARRHILLALNILKNSTEETPFEFLHQTRTKGTGRYTPEQFRPDEPARDRKTHDLWYEPAARPKW